MPRRRPVSQAELLRLAIEVSLSDVHVSIVGEVQAYDSGKQRADVLPLVRKPLLDEDGNVLYEDLPVIQGAVVVFPRGGGYGISWPLAKGDAVALLFSDQSYGEWRKTGKLASPKDIRRHGVGYPFVLPGFAGDDGGFTSLAGGGMRLGKDGADDQIRIDGGKIDVWLGGPPAARKGDSVNGGYIVLTSTGLVSTASGTNGYFPGDVPPSAVNATSAASAASALIPPGAVLALTGGVVSSGSSKVNVGG